MAATVEIVEIREHFGYIRIELGDGDIGNEFRFNHKADLTLARLPWD